MYQPLVPGLGWWLLALVVVLEAAALGAISRGNRRFAGNPIRLKLRTMLVIVQSTGGG
jgi:hypothetical protein